MPAPSLALSDVQRFLDSRFGVVHDLARLNGGFWSAAYSFRDSERELVARFGASRAWFEADQAAMAFAGPDLPVPVVLEIGDAFGGAYAISARHYGHYLELVGADRAAHVGPLLGRLLVALYTVPKAATMPVAWHGPPVPDLTWRRWLLSGLTEQPSAEVRGWRAKLAADPALDRLFRACEARVGELLEACPERRDLVHRDLLYGNVLVTDDASAVTAVYSWKCSLRGDFLYDTAMCTFWGGSFYPGIAASDPWRHVLSAPAIEAEPVALVDAAARHHCYELHIGTVHLGWNAWVGDGTALLKVAEHLEMVLERGPLTSVPSLGR